MDGWKAASVSERKQFEAISLLMSGSPHLVEQLFERERPRLRQAAGDLLREARGLSMGDYILCRLAVDIWCEQGEISVHELFNLDPDNFKRALLALEHCLA